MGLEPAVLVFPKSWIRPCPRPPGTSTHACTSVRGSCSSWWIFRVEKNKKKNRRIKSQSIIQFHIFGSGALAYDSSIREEASCPGFPSRSRCCWWTTLYQFPHEEPSRCSSANDEYGGFNLDGKLFVVGLIAVKSRERTGLALGLKSQR